MLDVIGALVFGAISVAFLVVLIGLAAIRPASKFLAFSIAGIWISLIVTIAALGGFGPGIAGPFPTPVIAFTVAVVLGLAAWLAWPAFRRAVFSIPLVALVGINGVRVAGVFFPDSQCTRPPRSPVLDFGRLGRHHCRSHRDPCRRADRMEGHSPALAVGFLERSWHPRFDYRYRSRSSVRTWDTLPGLHGSSWHQGDGNPAVGDDSGDPRAPVSVDTPGNCRAATSAIQRGSKNEPTKQRPVTGSGGWQNRLTRSHPPRRAAVTAVSGDRGSRNWAICFLPDGHIT